MKKMASFEFQFNLLYHCCFYLFQQGGGASTGAGANGAGNGAAGCGSGQRRAR